jgi:hypothetical protein
MREPARNPFSTRRVRPGALPFRFPPGKCADALVERLQENGWRGQIVGPHGSGKSALLAALAEALRRIGRRNFLVELHDGQRRIPRPMRPTDALAPGSVVIVDGYEQLSAWSRFRLRRFCRRRRLGLVVTAHVSVGFPDLYRTSTGLALVARLVDDLLGDEASRIAAHEVEERFRSHEGNVREVFFDLYDLYARRTARRT